MRISSKRIFWVDAAKAIGILLVIYGHIISTFISVGNKNAFQSYKFIYSFHMPLFFFIAGFFFKRRYESRFTEIKVLFYKRILPVLLFGLMALPLWIIYRILIWGYVDIPIYEEMILPYLRGQPLLNEITWFLVCLFMTEVIAIFVLPFANNNVKRVFVIFIFMTLGLLITANMKEYEHIFGIQKNTWYIHEALVTMAFYTMGFTIFNYIKQNELLSPIWRYLILSVSFSITFLTFNLNTPYEEFAVIMKESWHGWSLYFLVSAISGIVFVILLSTFIPENGVIKYIGQNTLILIGTTGIFQNFVNLHIITKLDFVNSFWGVTLFGVFITAIYILLSLPVIIVLNKYLPQLVGKPYQKGPILPNLY
jgi:fucose 4-O-acetylase-like acetyltransferase